MEKSRELAEQLAKTLTGYKSTVWGVTFSPDGQLVASGSHNDSLKVWNVAELEELFPPTDMRFDQAVRIEKPASSGNTSAGFPRSHLHFTIKG